MKTEIDNSIRTSSKQDSNIQQDKDTKIATPLSRYQKKKKLQSKAIFHFVKHELFYVFFYV